MKILELTLHFEVENDINLSEVIELTHKRIKDYNYSKECVRMSFLKENDLNINEKLELAEKNEILLKGLKQLLKENKTLEAEEFLNKLR